MSTPSSDSNDTAEPTEVRCRYTTVLHSNAARYFAVAPKKKYKRALVDALFSDVRQMISTNGGNRACCDAIELHTDAVQHSDDKAAAHRLLETGGAAPASPSSRLRCACMVWIDVTDIRKNFYGNLEFLGITFDVIMHIWEPSSTPALAAPADAMRAASQPAQASAAAVRGTVASDANLRPAALNCLARDPSHQGVTLPLLGMDHHTGTQRTKTQGALDAMRCSAANRQQARGRTAVATTPSSNTSFALFDLPEQKPAMPFAWSLPRNNAFPYVRTSVLKALTRKSYLSAYKRDVYVFADLTLDDLLKMLSIELSPAPDKLAAAQARTASQAVSSTGAAVGEGAPAARVAQGHARRTAGLREVFGTESEHYCHLLVTPEATLIQPPEGMSPSIPVTRDGTEPYPPVLVKVAQDVYHIDFSSDYRSITGVVSILCTLVIIALPVCAALAHAHQVWRRRREKRADMRRLLQHDLR